MFHKAKNKNKKYFCRYCLQCFGCKNMLTEHKEIYLKINSEQSVKLKFLLNLKSILDKYLLHLKFMLILSLFYPVLKELKK